jgi:hypothetical protein
VLFRIKGTLSKRDIIISIVSTQDNNYDSTKCANQLVILESNIIETIDSMDEKKHEISNLQLSIGDYTFVSQFTVKSLFWDDSDSMFILDGSTRVFHLKHEGVFDIFL